MPQIKVPHEFQTIQGDPINMGATTITPYSRRLSFGLSDWLTNNKGFALVWHQPTTVRVEKGGQAYTVPIRDYNKMIILALLLITAVCIFLTHRVGPKEKTNE